MARYFRAVALDFDGTLSTRGQRPRREVLESIRRTRMADYHLILVTGRILSHLREDFPDFDQHFDAVVAENGAVLATEQGIRTLVTPVDRALANALTDRGVKFRHGQVLLDCSARDAVAAMEEIRRLGLDSQLIFNREALMILPAGITKGTGLREALAERGISYHNAIAVGDAENDHALLDECEIGVAVGNAVPALKLHADRILDQPAGEGVRELLDGPLLGGVDAVYSRRWQLRLGTTRDGTPLTVPASQSNVLICGDSGSGKSHVAGLFAERLIALGYCVLVVDPEGDHLGLARMRDTVRRNAADGLPSPAAAVQLLRERLSSVILDASGLTGPARDRYLSQLSLQVALQRHAYGLPHWLLIDEAQDAPASLNPSARIPTQSNWGYCLVSWRPEQLDDDTLDQIRVVIAVASGQAERCSAAIAETVARVSGHSAEHVREVAREMAHGQAMLAATGKSPLEVFTVATRATEHVRHWHKYTAGRLKPEQWFYFRDRADQPSGSAANITELQVVLSGCEDAVLRHHARGHDLSQWIRRVFQDPQLADELAVSEAELASGVIPASVARIGLMSAIRRRYGV